MMRRISFGPAPSMFILDKPSLRLLEGSIMLNIRPSTVFDTDGGCGLRNMLRPQKVKNIVTLRPLAAAPLAMIKEAIALSRSPLKTTMVLAGSAAEITPEEGEGDGFVLAITASMIPPGLRSS
ncbi:hypothetical protein D3C80_1634310 [compost metagenome]